MIDDAFAPKIARATSTIDRSSRPNWSSAESTPAATAALRSALSVIRPSYVRGDLEQDALQLERRQPRVLAEDQRGDRGNARRGEAVPGRADRPAAEPGDVDVDSVGEELNRWIRVRVEDHRVALLVAADRDHRREAPWERLDRHVVRRGDEHGALEVRRVGQLVQGLAELSLRRREAHVDDVVPLPDRPVQPGDQHLPGAAEAAAEDANGIDLGFRRDPADHAGACGPVPAEIALFVGLGDRAALLVEANRDRTGDLAD